MPFPERSVSNQPDEVTALPPGSLFVHVAPESFFAHLNLYLTGQALSERHLSGGMIRSAEYLFNSDAGLFPNEIQELRTLVKDVETEGRATHRVTRESVDIVVAANKKVVVLPKSGRGRGWFGFVSEMPADYQLQGDQPAAPITTLNLTDYIFFALD